MWTGRPRRIRIPPRLEKKLQANRELDGGVLLTLNDFEPWLEDNKLVFFPEYTDHGPDHVRQVIEAASSLIADHAWRYVTAEDAALIVLASLLHDCAMHLSEDGFVALITQEQPNRLADDRPWPDLWETFLTEASRFDGRRLSALFGDSSPIRTPPLDASRMDRRDRMLIGEFLRRHHARLAHEIALNGVPGPTHAHLTLHVRPRFADLAGQIARSHGLAIRHALDRLAADDRRIAIGAHPPFIMALLRIADYLQVQAERAPDKLLTVRALRSPVSRAEWRQHGIIESIENGHADPEAIYIKALPQSAGEFVKARALFQSIQQELDESWAVLGETYGRFGDLSNLSLTLRRIRSSLDDVDEFAKRVSFVPAHVRFTTAGADLLKLLVGPLYDNKTEIGLRELVQNSVDAVLEMRDYRQRHAVDEKALPDLPADVVVRFTPEADDQWVLTVEDRGIGMTLEVVQNYFLCAGASFRDSDAWHKQHTEAGASRVSRSGRFGVGVFAAFLVGDRIEVTTRHITESAALTFSASLGDDVINVSRTVAAVGTTIKVRLRDRPPLTAEYFRRTWDWYCLTDPMVVIYDEVGAMVYQMREWPGLAQPVPPSWRRIKPSGFAAVDWSYWTEPAGIACNGIFITATERIRLVGGDLALSVFDGDAWLPLNLQRTEIIDKLPFLDELLDDIVRDLIVFTALYAPEEPFDFISAHKSNLHHPAVGSDWLASTPAGWSLSECRDGAPTEILLPRRARGRPLARFVDLTRCRVRPIELYSYSHADKVMNMLIICSTAAAWKVLLPSVVMRDSAFSAVVSNRNAKVQKLTNRFTLISSESSFDATLNFEELAEAGEACRLSSGGIGEIHVTESVPEYSLARRWMELLDSFYGSTTIPFARAERSAILNSTIFEPYANAHRQMAILRKTGYGRSRD